MPVAEHAVAAILEGAIHLCRDEIKAVEPKRVGEVIGGSSDEDGGREEVRSPQN